MSALYVKIDRKQSGQPRPYADSEYVNELTFSQDDGRTTATPDSPKVPWTVDEKTARAYAFLSHPWVEKDDPNYNWASPTLVALDMLTPTPTWWGTSEGRSDRWVVHVREAYTG